MRRQGHFVLLERRPGVSPGALPLPRSTDPGVAGFCLSSSNRMTPSATLGHCGLDLAEVRAGLPTTYTENPLALVHKSRHFVYVGFLSRFQVRDTLQMRVQPIPVGGQNWARVLFFKLKFLFLCTLKNIKCYFAGMNIKTSINGCLAPFSPF